MPIEAVRDDYQVLRETEDNRNDWYHIRPGDIRISASGLIDTFGKIEVEASVGRLILFFQCRKRGLWAPFVLEEIMAFYRENNWNPNAVLFGFWMTWLDEASPQMGMEWKKPKQVLLVQTKDGTFFPTTNLVLACTRR